MSLVLEFLQSSLRVSTNTLVLGEQAWALASFNGLLWSGGVGSSVGVGCGLCGGVLEKAGRKTLSYRTEEILRQPPTKHTKRFFKSPRRGTSGNKQYNPEVRTTNTRLT